MIKQTPEKQQTEKRKTDKFSGLSRSAVFILTVIVSILLTVLVLYNAGFITLIEKDIQPVKQVIIPDYSQDIVILKENIIELNRINGFLASQINNLENKIQNLPQPVTQTIVQPQQIIMNNSPLSALNYLLINYKNGGDISQELEFLKTKIPAELIEDFDTLVNISQPKVIKKHDIFMLIKHNKKQSKKENIIKKENKSFIDSLIVVRKKEVKKEKVNPNKRKLLHSLMKSDFKTVEQLLNGMQEEEFNPVKELIKKYIFQQKALKTFTELLFFKVSTLNGITENKGKTSDTN